MITVGRRQEQAAGAGERFSISHLSMVIWHFGMEDVRNAGFKFEVQLNIQQERLCVVLLLFTPGFSQVNEDTQLILKPFKRFSTSACPTVTWLKPGVNES